MTAIGTTAMPGMARTGAQSRYLPPLPVGIYVLATLLPIAFRLGPLIMTSVRLFLLMMFVPLVIRLLLGRCGRVLLVDVLMVAHIAWATLALAINNPGQVIEQAGSVGLEFIGGYLVGRAYIRNREDFIALIRLLVVLTLLFVPFFVYETLTGKALMLTLINALPGLLGPQDLSIDKRMGLNRVQFTFVHPIHFGLYCSVVFSLCFVGLKGVMPGGRRIVSGIIIAASGFLALSSGALLAIILQIGLIAWAFVFRQVKMRWWLLIGMFVLAYIVIDLLSNRTPMRVFMTYATFSAHTAYWRMIIFDWGMKNVWANPIFGLGLNDWVRPSYMRSGSMDNFWLVMAVRYGIPGFLFLAAGYLLALFRIMARDFTADTLLSQLRLAWVLTFVGLSFTLYTVHVWSNVYSFVFFMFGAGIWMIDAQPDAGGTPSVQPVSVGMRTSRLSREDPVAPVYTRFPDGTASAMRPAAIPLSRGASGSAPPRTQAPPASRFLPQAPPQ